MSLYDFNVTKSNSDPSLGNGKKGIWIKTDHPDYQIKDYDTTLHKAGEFNMEEAPAFYDSGDNYPKYYEYYQSIPTDGLKFTIDGEDYLIGIMFAPQYVSTTESEDCRGKVTKYNISTGEFETITPPLFSTVQYTGSIADEATAFDWYVNYSKHSAQQAGATGDYAIIVDPFAARVSSNLPWDHISYNLHKVSNTEFLIFVNLEMQTKLIYKYDLENNTYECIKVFSPVYHIFSDGFDSPVYSRTQKLTDPQGGPDIEVTLDSALIVRSDYEMLGLEVFYDYGFMSNSDNSKIMILYSTYGLQVATKLAEQILDLTTYKVDPIIYDYLDSNDEGTSMIYGSSYYPDHESKPTTLCDFRAIYDGNKFYLFQTLRESNTDNYYLSYVRVTFDNTFAITERAYKILDREFLNDYVEKNKYMGIVSDSVFVDNGKIYYFTLKVISRPYGHADRGITSMDCVSLTTYPDIGESGDPVTIFGELPSDIIGRPRRDYNNNYNKDWDEIDAILFSVWSKSKDVDHIALDVVWFADYTSNEYGGTNYEWLSHEIWDVYFKSHVVAPGHANNEIVLAYNKKYKANPAILTSGDNKLNFPVVGAATYTEGQTDPIVNDVYVRDALDAEWTKL